MNAKMKGLFKGLRYISSIFDPEEKEKEIVIGFPTDVKHVSHIGCDGPNVDSGPSWMKEFKSTEEMSQSPSSNVGDTGENPETILTSEDSQRKASKAKDSSRDQPEISKSSRRHNKELSENTSGISSPRKEKRNSRRRSAKEPSENSNSGRQLQIQEITIESESPTRNSLDMSKHTRRRSSKESPEHSNSNRQLQIQDGSIMGSDSPARNSRSKKSKEFGIDPGSIRSSRSKGKRSGVDSAGHEDRESPSISNEYSVRSKSKERKEHIQVSRVN